MSDVEARMAALCRRFAASAEQQGAALRGALQANDRDRAAEVAHHLAGAAGIFGQPDLGARALRLEEVIDARADDSVLNPVAEDVLAALDQLAQSR